LYPKEYIQFLAHFHGDRDYFECHEILEEYWKKNDVRNKNSIWVGLILLAVSTYHHRRNNFTGAKRTLEKAITIFKTQSFFLTKLSLDPHLLQVLVKERLSIITKQQRYNSFNLPISDQALLELCRRYCEQNGLVWGKDSDLANDHLVHRHVLRDRTSVIEERIQSLKLRKGND
jgi:predicted metal-dependent hydrolase